MSDHNSPQSLANTLADKLKEANTHALRNTACIATFSSSRYGDEVKDDDLSRELGSVHNSSSSNFNVRKKLFAAECPELDTLERHVRSTYTKHRALTQPWKRRGGGLLPNAKIVEYLGVMGEASQKLASLRDAARAALPQAHARAKVKLGSAYKESDYNDLMSIPDRFEIHFELEPVPESEDLVLPEGYEKLQLDGLHSGVRARFARAIETQWHRVRDAITSCRDKCRSSDTKRWHASMLSNIDAYAGELLDFMDALGVFGEHDAMMAALRVVRGEVRVHDVRNIAASEGARTAAAVACDRLLAVMVGATGELVPSPVEIVDEDVSDLDSLFNSVEQELSAQPAGVCGMGGVGALVAAHETDVTDEQESYNEVAASIAEEAERRDETLADMLYTPEVRAERAAAIEAAALPQWMLDIAKDIGVEPSRLVEAEPVATTKAVSEQSIDEILQSLLGGGS